MTKNEKNEALFDALPSVEELNSIYKPSESLDRKIRTLIKSSYRKSRTKKAFRKGGKIVASIAVVITLLSAVLLSVEATRNAIFNAIIEWHEEFAEVRFEDSEEPRETSYAPSYLPDGYSEQSQNKIGNSFMIIYVDQSGNRIIFDQKPTGTGAAFVDSENNDYTEIEIGGEIGHLFESTDENEVNILIWQTDGYTFQISSSIESEELIKVGESVRK